MKKYSLFSILSEVGWGSDPWGDDPWGSPSSSELDDSGGRSVIHTKTSGGPQTSADVEGYTAPLGSPAGFGWGGVDKGFASVTNYAGGWADSEFAKFRPLEVKGPADPGSIPVRKGVANSYKTTKEFKLAPRKLSNIYKYSKV